VTTPDGLTASCDGPHLGSIDDWRMWHESNIEDKLRPLLSELDTSNMLYIYGDPAYGCAFGVIGAYRRTSTLPLSQEQLASNKAMAKVRISVENIFGLNIRIWAYNSYKYSLRARHSPVATLYLVGMLLTNIRTCISGNQVSQYFECTPLSLDEYFASIIVVGYSGHPHRTHVIRAIVVAMPGAQYFV
jgi:DDE superfamily endonuclease